MEDKLNDEKETQKDRGYLDRMGYDPDSVLGRSSAGKTDNVDIDRGKDEQPSQMPGSRSRTILMVVGIILLVVSTVFAATSISDPETETLADTAEYKLFQDTMASSELNYEPGPGTGYFEAGKVMAVQGVDLKTAITADNEVLQAYEFSIEIIDISDYPVDYSRLRSENNAVETATLPVGEDEGSVISFETAVNIFVSDNEVHTAKLIMHIWKV